MPLIETRTATGFYAFELDDLWAEHDNHEEHRFPEVRDDGLTDDEYAALAYAELDEELAAAFYDEEWRFDFEAEPPMPTYGGGTQPKIWWLYSRKDADIEHMPRKRARDFDIRVPSYWKHGRDLPDTWAGRGCGKNRQVEQQAGETFWEFCNRKAEKQRGLRHTSRRQARRSIRTMKTAALAEAYDAHQFVSDHMDL